MRKILIISAGIIIFGSYLLGYNWPLKPFDKRHQINSTFGEYRNGHFHKGVDIKPFGSDTTDTLHLVYSIISDTSYRTNGGNPGVRVGKYYYIHLKNRIQSETYVTAFQDTVGRIQPTEAHLHFHWTSRYPPLSDTVLNPLWTGALTPYADSTNPYIDSIKFYRQGPGDTLLTDTLNRKVDMLVVARDTRTDTTGHAPSPPGTTSVYRIGYEILNTLCNIVKPYWEKIRFDTIPDPTSTSQLNLTYGSGSTISHFRYWITNDPFNPDPSLQNWYWNTKQKVGEPDSVDADCIEDAKFPDDYYWVKVLAYDIRDNFDAESVKVYLDNFLPKVLNTYPKNNGNANNPDTNIIVIFSESMDTNTITSSIRCVFC